MHELPEPRTVQPCATPYGTDAAGNSTAPPDWLLSHSKPEDHQLPAYKAQRRYIQHVRLPMCGHKFAAGSQPRFTNCDSCWFAFFQVHGELTQSAEEFFQQHGLSALSDLRGKKFARNFLKFMATVARWKQQLEAPPEVKESVD